MAQETIRILAKKNEIKIIKNIFQRFESQIPHMKIAAKKIGEFSDKAVVSIKVDKANYAKMVEIFVMNGLKIHAINEQTKKLIDSIKKRLEEGMDEDELEKGRAEVKPIVIPISDDRLEELARNGDYEEIKRLSKDIIHFSENFVKSIGDLLSTAVTIAIENALLYSKRNMDCAEESIQKLMKISSDVSLRSFNKRELLVKAGLAAISICEEYLELMSDLIDIANNSKVPNLVSVKAAVKFSEVILEDDEFFEKEVEYAVRKLNTRWLMTAHDVASKFLDAQETALFDRLIAYIESKKTLGD